MKKFFMIGLIMALTPNMCPAYSMRYQKLIAEKQAKLKKLESCQGTAKNLKIAGLSTLGITAVGVGANIAEAVVLNKREEELSKQNKKRDAAKSEYDKALSAKYEKQDRQAEAEIKERQEHTCNMAIPQAVDSLVSAVESAQAAVSKANQQDICKLPEGMTLSGCKDGINRSNSGYAQMFCEMDFQKSGEDKQYTHYFNFTFPVKKESQQINETVTGCDAAKELVKSKNNISYNCTCDAASKTVTCKKNIYSDIVATFTNFTADAKGLQNQKQPAELIEFQNKVGLYEDNNYQQAKRIIDWYQGWSKFDVDVDTCDENSIHIDSKEGQDTIKCGNVTVYFYKLNAFDATAKKYIGQYFCEKFGGEFRSSALNENTYKCSVYDEEMKACINYVYGSTVYKNVGSTCKTPNEVKSGVKQAVKVPAKEDKKDLNVEIATVKAAAKVIKDIKCSDIKDTVEKELKKIDGLTCVCKEPKGKTVECNITGTGVAPLKHEFEFTNCKEQDFENGGVEQPEQTSADAPAAEETAGQEAQPVAVSENAEEKQEKVQDDNTLTKWSEDIHVDLDGTCVVDNKEAEDNNICKSMQKGDWKTKEKTGKSACSDNKNTVVNEGRYCFCGIGDGKLQYKDDWNDKDVCVSNCTYSCVEY